MAASLSALSAAQTPSLLTLLVVYSNSSGQIIETLPTPTHLSANSPFAGRYLCETYESSLTAFGLKYKPVDQKIRLVTTTMPEDVVPKRHFPEDPLLSLPPISAIPPPILQFGSRLTKECWNDLKIDRSFLWEEELKLAFQALMNNELGIVWDDSECGTFHEDYFEPVVIPTIEHEPWALKNIPISPGLKDKVIKFVKTKIDSGFMNLRGPPIIPTGFVSPRRTETFK